MPELTSEPAPGILVVVKDGRYECHSFQRVASFRDQELFRVITEAGGISDSVAEGSYVFNIELIGGVPMTSLEPLPQ